MDPPGRAHRSSPAIAAAVILEASRWRVGAYAGFCAGTSVPVAAIPLGRRLPAGSSGLPGGVDVRAALPLSGLAPDGVCRATRVTPGAGALLPHRFTLACARPEPRHRRSVLCGTFLRVAPTGYYPAPCPVESGRSSDRWPPRGRPRHAAAWPTRHQLHCRTSVTRSAHTGSSYSYHDERVAPVAS